MFELGTKAETIREMTTVWFKGRYDIGLKSQNRNNGEEKGKTDLWGAWAEDRIPVLRSSSEFTELPITVPIMINF